MFALTQLCVQLARQVAFLSLLCLPFFYRNRRTWNSTGCRHRPVIYKTCIMTHDRLCTFIHVYRVFLRLSLSVLFASSFFVSAFHEVHADIVKWACIIRMRTRETREKSSQQQDISPGWKMGGGSDWVVECCSFWVCATGEWAGIAWELLFQTFESCVTLQAAEDDEKPFLALSFCCFLIAKKTHSCTINQSWKKLGA